MAGPSIISIPPGMMPALMMAVTVSPAASDVSKPIRRARAIAGVGRMRTVTSVMTASRPSDPVTTPIRS